MNWDDVKLALAVARTGSLNRAAQSLGVNQSTVSRRLTGLEAALAVTLFRRSHQGLVPTDAGATFVARAAEVEARAEALLEAMRRSDGRPAGILRLTGNQWIIDHLLASGFGDFLHDNPGITLRTIAGRPHTSLWRGDPGVGLWFDASPVDGAFAVRLGTVPYATFQARGSDTPPGWVAFFDEDRPASAGQLTENAKPERAAHTRLTALDALTLKEAIAQGVGTGLLPVCIGEADQRIERVPSDAPALTRHLHFHAHPDTLGTPRVEALLGWLRAHFDRVFGGGSGDGRGNAPLETTDRSA